MNATTQHRALAFIDDHLDESIERLFQLLRVPSISTDPAYAVHCVSAARMLSDELAGQGFDAQVVTTAGHPVVLASHDGPGPGVLFYGHYDVQPVDPEDGWQRSPFEPVIETRADGSRFITARGASDDKGQLRTFLEACRAWKAVSGGLPCRVTIFLEGEEEAGSPSLEGFLTSHRDALQADFALICDTTMWDRDTPAITTRLRGGLTGELAIQGPCRDLHSGVYGGPARNPLQVLAQVLASMKDAQGRVTLEGFYDAVQPLDDATRAAWQGLDFNEEAFMRDVGLRIPAGEQGYSVLEQCWARPTAEINGMWGGYVGDGFKTVIPAEASAKVSFRLVADQDPAQVWNSFERHVRSQLPADCTVTFRQHGSGRAMSIDGLGEPLATIRAALSAEWGTDTALVGSGGSIPAVSAIREHLGIDAVMVGFALNDDNIHSPNEKYEVRSFHKGTRSWVRILGALGTQ